MTIVVLAIFAAIVFFCCSGFFAIARTVRAFGTVPKPSGRDDLTRVLATVLAIAIVGLGAAITDVLHVSGTSVACATALGIAFAIARAVYRWCGNVPTGTQGFH